MMETVSPRKTGATRETTRARTETDDARPERVRWGIRARILFWYFLVLAVAIVVAILADRQVLISRIDAQIDESLLQEAQELRRMSHARDPRTGERFGPRVDRLFEVFLQGHIPAPNETYLTFIEGRPFEQAVGEPPYRLDRDPQLVRRWAGVTTTDRGRVSTSAGTVEYLAVPVKVQGEPRGVFVAAVFRDRELADASPALWGAVGVGVAALLVGSLLAWRVAEGVLRPVREVTDTAGRMSTGDLSERIRVRGHDEISQLATTFNDMLERLEEAFRIQRQFVDDAGHELRTPITVIRGHLELLDEDPVERRKTIALVMDELERMNRIVNDLLLLAKAEQPDFLHLETVDLEALTRDIHAKATALAPRDWHLESVGHGLIVADRQRLTQSVMELAQNAVQHTPAEAPVALGSAVTNGRARLWVRDGGLGIAEAEHDRIFRRFARVRDGTQGSQTSGLGLSIVRAIAEAHHGKVEVHSHAGAGATFTMVIPVDQPREEGP